MSKPENTFIASVHKHLPPNYQLHREKMNNPYRSGGADCWYSGRGEHSRDLWIEWKFLPKLPVRSKFVDVPELLSPLQRDWLRNRCEEGRNVWVIVGSPDGGIVLRSLAWELPFPTERFRNEMLDRRIIAKEIVSFCLPLEAD